MKKIGTILSITVLICMGCGKNDTNNESKQEQLVEKQEEALAKEAQQTAINAKEDAASTEEEVDELLKDI